jgi:hypothetical protein
MSGNNYAHINELRRQHIVVRRYKDWQRWKLGLPLAALILIYLISKFLGSGDEFINAFGHGDLLLFSALVLLELSVEATHINADIERDVPDHIDSLIENSRFFSLIIILIYGAMKFVVGNHSGLNQMGERKLEAYCWFTLSVTFLVVSFSIFAFWKTLNNIIGGKDV